MTDIIRVILYVGGDGAVHRRPGGRKAVPEWNALTYKVAHRGALFCSLASAQLGTIILWLRLLRQQRAASIALGSPPSLPSAPGVLGPGSWVPTSSPLPGHTPFQNTRRSRIRRGCNASIVLPMRTPTRSAATTTRPCTHGLWGTHLPVWLLCCRAGHDSRALVLNGRLPDPSIHSSSSRLLD